MTQSLDKVVETGDKKSLSTLLDQNHGLPEAKEQIAKQIKDAKKQLEDCQQQYLKLCTKLDILRAGSESLNAIICDSK